jgi:hypothetical protein
MLFGVSSRPGISGRKAGATGVVEFQKILDHPQLTSTDPIGALARFGLARAYNCSGDQARSRAEYSTFLKLWKNADSNIPVLKQAVAEAGKLRR